MWHVFDFWNLAMSVQKFTASQTEISEDSIFKWTTRVQPLPLTHSHSPLIYHLYIYIYYIYIYLHVTGKYTDKYGYVGTVCCFSHRFKTITEKTTNPRKASRSSHRRPSVCFVFCIESLISFRRLGSHVVHCASDYFPPCSDKHPLSTQLPREWGWHRCFAWHLHESNQKTQESRR